MPLLQKLEQIGINPYILRWVRNYLTEREQFVVVEGSHSPTLKVLSGVPLGSVLGPLLFVIYINDVANCISGGSKINLFADDIALYRIITSHDDYSVFQSDVNSIDSCLSAKHLTSSCTTLLKLYISFIRPHVEYAAAAWDPFLRKDIDLIEDVQKYALKVCLKSWSVNYSELLERSHLPTLQVRRHEAKLCHLYKIVNKETFFPNAPTLTRTLSYPSRSVHSKALIPIHAHSSQFLHSFPSAISAWNSLPLDTASASTIYSFKTAIKH